MSRQRWSVVILLSLLPAGAWLRAAAPPVTSGFVRSQLQRAERLEKEAYQHALAGRFAEALRLDGEEAAEWASDRNV